MCYVGSHCFFASWFRGVLLSFLFFSQEFRLKRHRVSAPRIIQCGVVFIELEALAHLATAQCACKIFFAACDVGGFDNVTQCGNSAVCNEDNYCECLSGYFSPSGSAADCRNIDSENIKN